MCGDMSLRNLGKVRQLRSYEDSGSFKIFHLIVLLSFITNVTADTYLIIPVEI